MNWKFWKRKDDFASYDSASFNIWELEIGKLYPAKDCSGVTEIFLPAEWCGEPVFLRRIDSTNVEVLAEITEEKVSYLSNLGRKVGTPLSKEAEIRLREAIGEKGLRRVFLSENCLSYREVGNMLLGFDKDTKWGEIR